MRLNRINNSCFNRGDYHLKQDIWWMVCLMLLVPWIPIPSDQVWIEIHPNDVNH